jgi:ribokinase
VVVTQHEVNMAATRHALEIARASGTLTVHNPAPPLADEDGSLLHRIDVLTPNESEFAHLLSRAAGREVETSALGAMGDAALHTLCRELRVPTVVLTLGSRGAFVSHDADDFRGDDVAYYRVDAELVVPVDTTGAGDAFTGALAAGLAAGRVFREAVRFANRVAGMSTETHGAASAIPLRAAVESRFG